MPSQECTMWRCRHVYTRRDDHCTDPECSNYYGSCPEHRGGVR